jgi:hypothetical protein
VLATTLWHGVPWVPLLAALISLLPAILSYRFVEQPLRSRTYDRRGLAVLGTATMVPPLLSAVLVLAGSAAGYGSPVIRGYQDASLPHIGTSCGDAGGESGAIFACSFNTDAAGTPVYLVGDSHADHISESVVGAAERLGRPAAARIAPGCQLIEGPIGSVGVEPLRACEEYFATTMEWLTGVEPGVVVISSAARPFWDPSIQLGPDDASMSSEADVKLRHLSEELTKSVLLLEAAGHTVVLVHDAPTFVEPYLYVPTECSLPALVSVRCDQVLPLAVAEDQQAGVRETIDSVATRTESITWDLRPHLCAENGCPSRGSNLVAYSDNNHLSVAEAEQLIDDFVAVLSGR